MAIPQRYAVQQPYTNPQPTPQAPTVPTTPTAPPVATTPGLYAGLPNWLQPIGELMLQGVAGRAPRARALPDTGGNDLGGDLGQPPPDTLGLGSPQVPASTLQQLVQLGLAMRARLAQQGAPGAPAGQQPPSPIATIQPYPMSFLSSWQKFLGG